MSITLPVIKRLWGAAGRECSYPDCEQRLFEAVQDETTGDEVVVGKQCHIVSQRADGPRNPGSLTDEEKERWKSLIENRDGYQNLVLMCGVHHDVIDGDIAGHPVARVVEIKQAHERDIDERLTPQKRNENTIEIRYAAIIEEWARRIDIDRWDGRISSVAASQAMRIDTLEDLRDLRTWLHTRVWPRTAGPLEEAFLNFRAISENLESVVEYYGTRTEGMVLVDQVYREEEARGADEKRMVSLRARSDYYQDLACDLAIELTRAVNLVCDRVREEIWPTYRLEEGYATIGLGLDASLSFQTLRPLYPPNTEGVPYPGLRQFAIDRKDSDAARGEGLPPGQERLPGSPPPWMSEGDEGAEDPQ